MNDQISDIALPDENCSPLLIETQIFMLVVAWIADIVASRSDSDATPVRGWLLELAQSGVDALLEGRYEVVAEYVYKDFLWTMGATLCIRRPAVH